MYNIIGTAVSHGSPAQAIKSWLNSVGFEQNLYLPYHFRNPDKGILLQLNLKPIGAGVTYKVKIETTIIFNSPITLSEQEQEDAYDQFLTELSRFVRSLEKT